MTIKNEIILSTFIAYTLQLWINFNVSQLQNNVTDTTDKFWNRIQKLNIAFIYVFNPI